MVGPSKLFQWPLKTIHCSQLPLHRHKTCFHSFLYDFYRFSVSGARYYSPLILSPLILKGNKMSLKDLIDTLRFYIETIVASSTTGSLVFGFICLFRNLFGEFRLWPTFVLSAYVAAQACWWFSKRSHRIFLMSTTQVALEALLRQQKSAFTYFLLNSKLLQALIFMTSSTIIMHYKHLRLYNGFWFIQPELVPTKKNINQETRSEAIRIETTWKNLFKYSKTYFIYGLSLDVLSAVLKRLSSFKTKGLIQVLWSAVKGLRLNMTYFFITYAGIYKLSLHYIHKYMDGAVPADLQQAIASFFGGASYLFLDKLTCNTFALILAVQIFWQNYCRKAAETKQENRLLDITKIPFGHILLPINISFMVYTFFYETRSLNSLGVNLVRAVTDQKIQRLWDYIMKNDPDFIFRDSSLKPLMGAF